MKCQITFQNIAETSAFGFGYWTAQLKTGKGNDSFSRGARHENFLILRQFVGSTPRFKKIIRDYVQRGLKAGAR